jgi:hypothetical protein
VLKSGDVTTLFNDLHILITRGVIGKVMKQRGIKRSSEGVVRVGKKVIRSWWFTEPNLIEHGLNMEESRIPIAAGGIIAHL